MTKNNLEPIKLKPTLHIALTSLERFPWLHLFPVAFDNKAQPLPNDYLKQASNDPAQITRKSNLTALIVGGASRRHFFDHDAPTFEDILEGWKSMDAERKRVFAVPPY